MGNRTRRRHASRRWGTDRLPDRIKGGGRSVTQWKKRRRRSSGPAKPDYAAQMR